MSMRALSAASAVSASEKANGQSGGRDEVETPPVEKVRCMMCESARGRRGERALRSAMFGAGIGMPGAWLCDVRCACVCSVQCVVLREQAGGDGDEGAHTHRRGALLPPESNDKNPPKP
eukprot:887558-Rhodomonas_salina.2